MARFQKKSLSLLTVLFFFISFIFCEQIKDNDFGFSLDIPEGYEISDYTEDGMSYVFTHKNIPVTLVMKISEESGLNNSSDILKANLKKLNAKGDTDSFIWSEKECSVSTFSMNLDKEYAGWALCSPVKIDGFYLILFCYAPADKKGYEQFIISTINSLCIDEQYLNSPGIITSYAFPKEGSKNLLLTIGGKQIQTSLDKSDIEAAKFVVDLEYSVLCLYANHKLWKEAWQRYYRMIYKDNAGRMQTVAADIYNALYPELKLKYHTDADIKYAQKLLSWVQTFSYERAKSKNESDFTSIPASISGSGSDCDSRSMLISILLNYAGLNSAILISKEYSHAMVVTDIPAPGQTYTMPDGREYLFGETTAKVTWGMLAQEHADRTKWIPVSFD